MRLRDAGVWARGRLVLGLARALRAPGAGAPPAPLALEAVLAQPDPHPLDLARVFAGRPNRERQAMVARYLRARGAAFTVHPFSTLDGGGENYAVDIGAGDRVLVLIAHHDAVPGSPGANDNAAALGLLLRQEVRLRANPAPNLRVRLLFTGAEELGYLGARAYVREAPPAPVGGVISLELCGVGDSPVLWDVDRASPLTAAFGAALEGLGGRLDESYHLVGRIPGFGSDHRAFAARGIPAYGLTMVPRANAEALRRFIWSPWRTLVRTRGRPPAPFDTYHSPRDRAETLDPLALDRVTALLDTLVRTF